jgi:hypothetical protein
MIDLFYFALRFVAFFGADEALVYYYNWIAEFGCGIVVFKGL